MPQASSLASRAILAACSLVTPATPGHYKFQGAQAGMPGVNYMVQINSV